MKKLVLALLLLTGVAFANVVDDIYEYCNHLRLKAMENYGKQILSKFEGNNMADGMFELVAEVSEITGLCKAGYMVYIKSGGAYGNKMSYEQFSEILIEHFKGK